MFGSAVKTKGGAFMRLTTCVNRHVVVFAVAAGLGLTGRGQTTLSGTVSNGTAAVGYAHLAFHLNDLTNWVPQASTTAPWVSLADGAAGGTYSRAFASTPTALNVAALVIGYARGVARVAPPSAPAQSLHFLLSPGVMRAELDVDGEVTCSMHSSGYRPLIVGSATASGGHYLRLAHSWTQARLKLYFPVAGEYRAAIRYKTASVGVQLQVGDWHKFTCPGTAGAWKVVTNTFQVTTSAAWQNIDLYAESVPPPPSDDGLDYVEIWQVGPYNAAAIGGTVTDGASPLANVRMSGTRDGSTNWPGGTFFADGAAAGTYALTPTPSAMRTIDVSALAIGYSRATQRVAPVAPATLDFVLTPGTLRTEFEYDTTVTASGHSSGYAPIVVASSAASSGHFVQCCHIWTQGRLRLYYPQAGEYVYRLRYRTSGATVQWRMGSTAAKYTWPTTSSTWVTRDSPGLLVPAAGWYDADFYGGTYTGFGNGDGFDYVEVIPGGPLVSGLVTGTVISAGSPVANVRLTAMRDGGTNYWPGASFYANSASGGGYRFASTPSAVHSLDVAALAIGYQRQMQRITPMGGATQSFSLARGTLRIEAESDTEVTADAHGEGYMPKSLARTGASQGRYLQASHNWTQARTWLYFPDTGEYKARLAYRTRAASVLLKSDATTKITWTHSANLWKTNDWTAFTVAAGWHYIDLYLAGADKGDNGEGMDFLEVIPGERRVSATIDGAVSAAGPFATARVLAVADSGTDWPGYGFSDDSSGGTYSLAVAAIGRVDLAALAIGYQRATAAVTPVANATRDFSLTPGTLRLEAESDLLLTAQMHGAGYVPQVWPDSGASAGKYVSMAHNWTRGTLSLHFPARGQYFVRLRYLTRAVPLLFRVDGVTAVTFPAAGGAWLTSEPVRFAVSSAGWHTIELYGELFDGSYTGSEGVDFLEITQDHAGTVVFIR